MDTWIVAYHSRLCSLDLLIFKEFLNSFLMSKVTSLPETFILGCLV